MQPMDGCNNAYVECVRPITFIESTRRRIHCRQIMCRSHDVARGNSNQNTNSSLGDNEG